MPASMPRRIWIYRRLSPDVLTKDMRRAAGIAVTPALVVGLLLGIALADGDAPAGTLALLTILIAGPIIVVAIAVQLVRTDRRLSPPLPTLPELASSPRLALTWSTEADVADLRASVDDEVRRANGWTDEVADNTGLLLQIPVQAAANQMWTARDPATGAFVGSTSIAPDPCDPTVGSIGGWLAPAWRGQGLGAEMMRLAVLSTVVAYRRPISAATSLENTAMRRAIEHAGGIELQRYQHRLPDGTVVEAVRYGFVRTDTAPSANPLAGPAAPVDG